MVTHVLALQVILDKTAALPFHVANTTPATMERPVMSGMAAICVHVCLAMVDTTASFCCQSIIP